MPGVGPADGMGAAPTQGAGPSAPGAESGLDQLGSDAFLKLLVAQVQHQDPMDPADSTEMLQQTAMFSQVQALNNVQESQQELIGFQQGQMATGMVGQQVSGFDEAGEEVTGLVEGVRFTDDGPRLQLADGELALRDVTEVGVVDDAPAPQPPGDTPIEEPDDPVEDLPGDDPDDPVDDLPGDDPDDPVDDLPGDEPIEDLPGDEPGGDLPDDLIEADQPIVPNV